MADITPTSSTPKDMKQRMGAVKGINPDDPNFFVLPQLTLFFREHKHNHPPPHPRLPFIVY
jgi:hypothetical protein